MCSITHLSILDEYLLLYKKVSGRVSCAQTLAGGAGGTRTLDLCVANAPLSHLSYNPIFIYYNIDGKKSKVLFEIFLWIWYPISEKRIYHISKRKQTIYGEKYACHPSVCPGLWPKFPHIDFRQYAVDKVQRDRFLLWTSQKSFLEGDGGRYGMSGSAERWREKAVSSCKWHCALGCRFFLWN